MSAISSELQPIVLAAGSGSRMEQMLGSSLIKCLLPVRGFPLIYYPLKFLAQNGFTGKEVLIIVQEKEKDEIRRAIDKIGDDKLGLKLEFFTVSDDSTDEEFDFGTCQSVQLAYNARKIMKDVLLISCDTITNVDLFKFHQFHKTKNSDVTGVFLSNLTSILPSTTKLHGPKSKIKQERDIVGVDPNSKSLVFLASEADFDETISIPISMIKKCPYFKLYTSYTDTHIYIIKRKVLDVHGNDGSLKKHSSFKGEFIPFLLNSKYTDESTACTQESDLSFFAYMDLEKQCIRVNTLAAFSTINKLNDWLHKSFNIGLMPSRDGNDSKIAPGAKLLGGSLIGDQCVIGEKVKLTNTILMDDIEIGENSALDNCIVASGCRIGSKAILKECLIGPKYQIPSGSQHTNDYLTVIEDFLNHDH